MNDIGAWRADRAAEIIAAHQDLEGAALPILQALQAEFGHIPAPAVTMVADALNVSRAEMHGVVSFYHDFHTAAGGRHVLRLCRAEACQAMGGDALAAHARAVLGADWHGSSADGAVRLEPVLCLGLCACAPAAMLDGDPVGRLTADLLDELIADARRVA